ncbi:hypothetical protein ACNQUF_12390, partial [Corynebacterium diphtheriae]
WSVFGGGKAYKALTAQDPDLGGLLFSGLWDWMPEGYSSQDAEMELDRPAKSLSGTDSHPANDPARRSPWLASTPAEPHGDAEHAAFETSIDISLPLADSTNGQQQSYQWSVFGGGKAYKALTAQDPDLGGLLFSGLWDWM